MDGKSVSQIIERFCALNRRLEAVNSRFLQVEGSTLDCSSFSPFLNVYGY